MLRRSLETDTTAVTSRNVASCVSSERTQFSLQVTGEAAEVQIGEDPQCREHAKEPDAAAGSARPFSTLASGLFNEHFPQWVPCAASFAVPSRWGRGREMVPPVLSWLTISPPGGRNLTLIAHPWWSSNVKYRLLGLREPQKCLQSKAVGPAGVPRNAAFPQFCFC